MRIAAACLIGLSCASSEAGSNGAWQSKPCPAGTRQEQEGCRPAVILDCPAGTSFREGVGCVANVVGSTPPTMTEPSSPPPAGSTEQPASTAGTSATAEPLGPCGCRTGDVACLSSCGPRPPPLATASRAGGFDQASADNALVGAARAAQLCHRAFGPTGPGTIDVVFEPSGVVSRAAVHPPYAGTPVGACVERLFLQVTVPSFRGDAVSMTKSFVIE